MQCGYDPAYYLNFAENDSIRLSYSSSICENKISETESKQIKSDIARYDAISVREYESVDIVKSMGYDNVSVTIDPVLMLSVEEWKVFAAKSKIRLPKNIC